MNRRRFLAMLGLAPVAAGMKPTPAATPPAASPAAPIPRYANGGIVTPPLLMIGNGSPEMFIPASRRQVSHTINVDNPLGAAHLKASIDDIVRRAHEAHRKDGAS